MALTRNAEFYINRAADAVNAGFTAKSHQQAALKDLNTAYDYLRNEAHNNQISRAPVPAEDGMWSQERSDFFAAREMPFDLHNLRPKHYPIFQEAGIAPTRLIELVSMRAAVKAAPVNAPVRAEPSPFQVKAEKTLREMIELRQTQYLRAIKLDEIFGGLPVSANTHLATNDHGTTYLRTFWYLAGEFTPLMVIIAAAEELARRKDAA